MTTRYGLILYGREINRAFVVEVPELSGCAADDATYQEAMQNAKIVISTSIFTDSEGKPYHEVDLE